MEMQNKNIPMLELLLRPAFCVSGGKITKINQAAAPYLLCEGMDIMPLLATGAEEYREFEDGCLYLTLSIGPRVLGATVVAMDGDHLFMLEEASALQELRSLSLAARELRDPLTGMITTASQMFPHADADPTQRAQFNRRMYQTMRIISNMSDAYAYCQSGNERMEYVQICNFLEELLDKTAAQLQAADIHLQYSLPDKPIYTLADVEKLERAVYNLISNATKHTPAGGTIKVVLTHRKRLYLSVTDDGPGVAPGVQGNVYSRYLRTPALTDGQEGIGLGMVLVRCVATLHGGTVLIDQPQGQGTRVTMTMDIRQRGSTQVRSPILCIDYAGERDHGLQELADVLPASLYSQENID